MGNMINLENKVCVLIDPETRHIDYVPINTIKVTKNLTIEDLFKKFNELTKNVESFKKEFSESVSREISEYKLATDAKIEKLVKLITLLEGQIKILTANQSRLGECYNTLHEAFKKQTAHTLASTLNLEYAVKLLGGRL